MLRQKAEMTQEQLAEYMGVSKSAVSKWENGMTYPDIVLLPILATLFNISVDDLMGYEPQLTKAAIRAIYTELTKEVSQENIEAALKKSDEYLKKYYSCFPFLLQMAVFYLNHYPFFPDPAEIQKKARGLCKRIQRESSDPGLVKDAVNMEATILLMEGKTTEVLELLGEEAKPVPQEAEMIAGVYLQMGKIEKSKEITETCYFQHLLMTLGNGSIFLAHHMDDLKIVEETVRRLSGVIELYHIDRLHLNASLQFYANAAMAYMQHDRKEEAVTLLESYLAACRTAGYKLHGDDYFCSVDKWLETLELGVMMPINEDIVKQSICQQVVDNPVFASLQDNVRFQYIIKELKNL